MGALITGQNILKSFGSVKVLGGIDIEIIKGEFVAVMGTSGSGKSTLLYVLSGTDGIDSGYINVDSKEISILNEKELAHIRRTTMGFVFQQPTMLKNLNILDNILLPALNKAKASNAVVQKAQKLMAETGISGLENRDITEVSGGQLQRVGICRALINEPQIIFADEPTGALNSKSAEDIMQLFLTFNRSGTTIFLVTHDANIAAKADRVLFMKDGKITSNLVFGKFDVNKNADTERVQKIIDKMRFMGI